MTTRTFVDALGRVVQIPHMPQRLVSLVPSITEVLFSFARGQQVVGITDYCTEPAAAVATKTKIGGTKYPDLATILAVRPELVFAVAEENRRQDVEQLTAAGVPVYVFAPRTVRHGLDLLWRVGYLYGAAECINERACGHKAPHPDPLPEGEGTLDHG